MLGLSCLSSASDTDTTAAFTQSYLLSSTNIGRTFIKQMALAPAAPIAVEPHATRSRVGSFQSLPNENFCTTAPRAVVAAQQAAHVKAISAPVWSTTTKKISLLRPTPNFYGKVLLFLSNRQQNYSFESINRAALAWYFT